MEEARISSLAGFRVCSQLHPGLRPPLTPSGNTIRVQDSDPSLNPNQTLTPYPKKANQVHLSSSGPQQIRQAAGELSSGALQLLRILLILLPKLTAAAPKDMAVTTHLNVDMHLPVLFPSP